MDNLQTPLNFAPPGHFYSPHPDLHEVEARAAELFGTVPAAVPGVELNDEGQLALVAEFARYYGDLPWADEARPPLRYYYGNHFFCHGDAIALSSLLRHVRPRRVVEVGSGFSTAVMLDTWEQFGAPAHLTCIEPYPDRLRSLLRPDEGERCVVREQKLQDVEPALFATLAAGDVLFADCSHVSKVGSDVNRLVFEILPSLAVGVWVHFHDIFYPFEYPRSWFHEGRAWNEAYLLRAFLQYNHAFQIRFFGSYLHARHAAAITHHLPLTARNPGGSLWLQKVA